ncbi:hypothetical protein GIB67_020456 [Kingdonia uniflora]|uniref:RNA cytidine acetyltransferase n=1 Tax=Kingdonia uniflora TaxID=39325 RepID=A0A7J7LUZ9_9MAGN|nr:hypothetical protein GIB67_020456 [Kingdonia uniflora]
MRKKVDERIRTLIENGVKSKHRSMFVIIGDKSRDQTVNLHHLLCKASVKSRASVLWCYKNGLDLSSHRKKRQKQTKKLMQRGLLDPEKVDPFNLFLETAGLTFCLYKDSERILGQTFGMCILQDFEALTPNLLARTIETVEGGGLVILLLRNLDSLTSLYAMVMDVHERYRTESHSQKITGRFNERFLLSIASCKACVVMDDELNVLPISSHISSITPLPVMEDADGLSGKQRELKNLQEQFNDNKSVGPLLKKCCTLDQGNAVITFFDAILDKTLRSTVALLAARGRGKSAALGLAIAGSIDVGYSNIYVTAPSPENLKTLFEFICRGFDALEYKEHIDYDVVKSSNFDGKKVVVRINVYKQHRQTIQYIQPYEHEKLSQVELLVVDEAAAIPLPIVKSLIGPYLVFLSSTVNGYEGTGRSLSLKLLQQLEEQNKLAPKSVDNLLLGRVFQKVELSEAIRYAPKDPIEAWLHQILCLDAAHSLRPISRLPPASECDLYYVNRDTLFSYHKDSESILQQMMSLYVASHYKNSPNDLQLMADAPAHHLFVLLGPVDKSKNYCPDILCVIQVCLEGQISRKSVINSLSDGHSPSGDQIPWKFSEQFQDTVFPTLSGSRIVRIAVHPDAMRFGYGSVAVELLTRYFEGEFAPISEMDVENVEKPPVTLAEAREKVSLLEENIKPRTNLPDLFVPLCDRSPEKLNYIGVSFGLTLDLFRFWRKHKFSPFYIGHVPNLVTGERTCMMVKPLNNGDIEMSGSDEYGFLTPFYKDFRRRFIRLLGSTFRAMEYKLALSVLDPKTNFSEQEPTCSTSNGVLTSLSEILSPHDMKRLEAYTDNLVDFHMILDILPVLAYQYFQEKLPVTLSSVQASVLLCMGLQNQDLSYVEGEMKLERQQILSQFIKVMKKFYKYLYRVASEEFSSTLPRLKEIVMTPHSISVDEDLRDAANEIKEKMRVEGKEADIEKPQNGLLDPKKLQQFAIGDREADIETALQKGGGRIPSDGLLTVPTTINNRNKKLEKMQKESHKNSNQKRRGHDGSGSHNSKNKRKKPE